MVIQWVGNRISAVVSSDGKARKGIGNVQIQSVNQNMCAARPRIPGCQHNVARQLMLDVEVELLHHTLFEIKILRLNRSSEVLRIWRSRDGGSECLREAAACSSSKTAGLSSQTLERR